MERAQRIAALRRDLRSVFPSSHPNMRLARGRHINHHGLVTGIEALDALLSGQGLPRGRISELTGEPSSGKSALAFRILATTTRAGLPVAYIDAAGTFYPPSAAAAGIALDRLLLIKVSSVQQALKAADILLRGQAFPLVLFDWSLDPTPNPRLTELGPAVARLNGLCSLSQSVLLFVTTQKTARNPLRYYASVRIGTSRERGTSSAAAFDIHREQPEPPSSAAAFDIHREQPEPPSSAASFEIHRERPGSPPNVHSIRAQGDRPRIYLSTVSVDTNKEQLPALPTSEAPTAPKPSRPTGVPHLRLVGIPMERTGSTLSIHLLKYKLGPPGGQIEVALDGDESIRLPLYPGIPNPDPPAR